MTFRKIEDFDNMSRNGSTCSLTNLPKQGGKKARQTLHDHFVLRGPMIEYEGYFDVRPTAIAEVAAEFCDMVPASKLTRYKKKIKALEEELAEVTGHRDALEALAAEFFTVGEPT